MSDQGAEPSSVGYGGHACSAFWPRPWGRACSWCGKQPPVKPAVYLAEPAAEPGEHPGEHEAAQRQQDDAEHEQGVTAHTEDPRG